MRYHVEFTSSLKARIVLFTGAVLLLLLLVISQVLLFRWREAIFEKQHESVVAVSRTFAVTVIDALINEEQDGSPNPGVLQTYVDNFMRTLGNVKYVILTDNANIPLVSRCTAPNRISVPQVLARTPPGMHGNSLRIRDDADVGWVLEAQFPLSISQRSWGTATIGFDADPIRQEIRLLFILLFGSTVAVACVTLVVLYSIAQRLTGSLYRLVQEIDSVDTEGSPAEPMPLLSDEIAFLFYRFGLMKRRVELARDQVEQAQRQVYQAEKLASIGRLASGVAHQVNNPLNGIKSCLYAIRREPENHRQTREYIELISEGIISIETVVRKLLGFSRQTQSSASIDINESVQKVASLFELRLREKQLRVALQLAEHLPPARIDYHLFQEVIMNLILNSYDAVAEHGTITISTGLEGASSVFLSVHDDGIGIPQADLKKIFDPFYTTKEAGTGTGLGLSVCASIIEQHNGAIRVQSTEGSGATFTVTLPKGNRYEGTDH